LEVIIFDTNIFDLLAKEPDTRTRLKELIERKEVEVLIPSIIRDELIESPFKGIPIFFRIGKYLQAYLCLDLRGWEMAGWEMAGWEMELYSINIREHLRI